MIDAELVADLRRSFAAALALADPRAARAALVEAGWLDALAMDEPVAVALVLREQGRTVHDAAALDDVIANRLGLADLAVAHPAVAGLHVMSPANREAARVLWLDGGRAEVVELAGPIEATPIGGIDPAAGLLGLAARPAGTVTEVAPAEWARALAGGRIAIAHELVANAHEQLVLATAYAKDRKQFGAPIGTFQAVKHRLAETLVAIGAADSATVAAATTDTEVGALLAKVLAGRASDVAARHCLQVFGGIGFTTEHDFHHRFRRGRVLDRLLGDRRTLEREIGGRLRSGELDAEGIVALAQVPRVELLA